MRASWMSQRGGSCCLMSGCLPGSGAAVGLSSSAGEFEQVGLDVADLVFELFDVGVAEQGLQCREVVRIDHVVVAGQQAVQWGEGVVVLLGHFGAGAGLGDQFLLRQEQVDLDRDQWPELVEQVEFAGCVVAVVADVAAHDGPVLLLGIRLVVLVAGRQRVKVICRVVHQRGRGG